MNARIATFLVNAGRVISALPAVLFPFFLIAGAMSLGAGYGGIAKQCTGSMFGAFLCFSMAYPLIYFAGLFAARSLLKRNMYFAAVVVSWTALVLFLYFFFGSEAGNGFLPGRVHG